MSVLGAAMDECNGCHEQHGSTKICGVFEQHMSPFIKWYEIREKSYHRRAKFSNCLADASNRLKYYSSRKCLDLRFMEKRAWELVVLMGNAGSDNPVWIEPSSFFDSLVNLFSLIYYKLTKLDYEDELEKPDLWSINLGQKITTPINELRDLQNSKSLFFWSRFCSEELNLFSMENQWVFRRKDKAVIKYEKPCIELTANCNGGKSRVPYKTLTVSDPELEKMIRHKFHSYIPHNGGIILKLTSEEKQVLINGFRAYLARVLAVKNQLQLSGCRIFDRRAGRVADVNQSSETISNNESSIHDIPNINPNYGCENMEAADISNFRKSLSNLMSYMSDNGNKISEKSNENLFNDVYETSPKSKNQNSNLLLPEILWPEYSEEPYHKIYGTPVGSNDKHYSISTQHNDHCSGLMSWNSDSISKYLSRVSSTDDISSIHDDENNSFNSNTHIIEEIERDIKLSFSSSPVKILNKKQNKRRQFVGRGIKSATSFDERKLEKLCS